MATIDSSIPLGVRPAQIENPMNALARVLQVQGMQREQELGRLKVDEYQQGVQRKNKLYSLLDREYAKPEDREGALLRGGFVDEAGKLSKDRREGVKLEADTTKTKAETQKIDFDTEIKRIEHVSSVLSTAKDPASYQVAVQTLAQAFGPGIVAKLPPQFDPAVLQATVAQGMTIAQRLADERQRQQLAETARHNTTTEGLTARGQNMTAATAARGQNLVDARSREANSIGRVPAGYRQKADGTLEFIPGGPADPNAAKKAAPTEFQGKAAMFGARAQEADRIITELGGKFSPAGINVKQAMGQTPLIGGALEAGGNLVLSDASQKAEQAQRDFVNAVLRLESGAAIANTEFDNAKKQYFPQPGDAPAVIQQKAQNRKLAIQGLMNNARTSSGDPAKPHGGATGDWGGAGKVVDFGSLK